MSESPSSSKRSGERGLVVLSPHLDDAVFSAGGWLARRPGSVVVTAFAGGPPPGAPVSAWDAACGFEPGDDVMAARRQEDRAALAMLGARPVWLPFRDRQYGSPPALPDLVAALAGVLAALPSGTVLFPLGLFHSDHHLLHEAGLALRRAHPERDWLAYEDVPYRTLPGLVNERCQRLRALGLRPARATAAAPPPAVKRHAVACYRSQLRGLATAGRLGHGDTEAPEGCWRLGS